jgi:hypothetical protein
MVCEPAAGGLPHVHVTSFDSHLRHHSATTATCSPPAGAPPSNATFFCDGTSTSCFSESPNRASWTNARAACQAQGGDLVKYDTAQKQRAVESYFSGTGTLTSQYYWMGLYRDGPSRQYIWTDEGTVLQSVSQDPYAHWAWNFNAAAKSSGYDCVLAFASYSYDLFLGKDSDASDQLQYMTVPSNSDRKYGWGPYACSMPAEYICEVPASAYPCLPPPMPPPPPPQPPSPPSPPLPPSCKCLVWKLLRE